MKLLIKRVVLFSILILGFAAAEVPGAQTAQIIVNVTEARIRNQPNLRADIIAAAKLGSVYKVLETRRGWFKIAIESGRKTGWISGTIVENFAFSNRGTIYQRLADKYLKRPRLDFDTASELFEFLNRIQPEVANTAVKPDLAYKRLLALARALLEIPADKTDQNPYKRFTDEFEDQIAYSEPAGQFAVRTIIWWDLREEFSFLPIADDIAWEAAKTLIPGECEGYVPCHLYVIRATDGQYLEFYPTGKHASEALQNLREFLGYIAEQAEAPSGYYMTEPDDRVQLEKYVAQLRAIVSKTRGSSSTQIFVLLNRIEAGYKLPEPKP